MRKLRIGLNGLGRIGRAILRINQQRQIFDVVMINEINPDAANLAYTLQYDSVYGRLPCTLQLRQQCLQLGEQHIALSHQADILAAPWQEHEVDVLIDASGCEAHPARLLAWQDFSGWTISTHAVNLPGVQTVVFGVNEHHFNPHTQRRLSSSICDSVALAPIARLLQQHHGIRHGALTTLHPWLTYQRLQDSHASQAVAPDAANSHYALGRTAVNNLIPKSTSAVRACDVVLPGLSRRITSFSYRVPTNIVSSAVLDVELDSPCSTQQLHDLLLQAERHQQWHILHNSIDPKVSIDYCGSDYAATVDQRWVSVQDGHRARLVYWYDNEWGYASRVVDLVQLIQHPPY